MATKHRDRFARQPSWTQTRMGRFTMVAVLLWLAQWLILEPLFPAETLLLQVFYDLFWVLLLVPLLYYAFRASRVLKRRLLWKIRRRLILAHVFVALIPIALVISIFLLTALLIYYQFTYYLVLNQIGLHTGSVEAYTLSLRSGIGNFLERPTLDRSEFQIYLNREAQYIQANYPQASIHVQIYNQASSEEAVFHAGYAEKQATEESYKLPAWLNRLDYSGLVYQPLDLGPLPREGLTRRRASWSDLSLRAVAFADTHPEYRYSTEVSVPIDRFFLKKLKAALGVDLLLARPAEGQVMALDGTQLGPQNIIASTDDDPPGGRDTTTASPLPMHLYPVLWENGREAPINRADLLYLHLSLTRLYQNLFLSQSKLSQDIADILKFLLVFFLIVEGISVVIGVLLTKSITNSVYNLDRGTEIAKSGDFSHRIVVRSDDQLGTLAESFNKMIESVQGLMRERVEKERLERELEIAKEVQAQLFPKSSPAVTGLELSGLCLPARTVSGDYFDYLMLAPDAVGVIVGDICGKGISAALLMANLQATLRSQVSPVDAAPGHPLSNAGTGSAVARLMEHLNRQIYGFTSPNKFASLFSVVFDRSHGGMVYCNAGHNPPLLLKNGRVHKLKTGGTVVGIFQEATYAQESIALEPGDLLVAYTDGIVEAVNEFGEEFGEERLEHLMLRHRGLSVEGIQNEVVNAIVGWSYGQDRDDDMTLVVARINEHWRSGQEAAV